MIPYWFCNIYKWESLGCQACRNCYRSVSFTKERSPCPFGKAWYKICYISSAFESTPTQSTVEHYRGTMEPGWVPRSDLYIVRFSNFPLSRSVTAIGPSYFPTFSFFSIFIQSFSLLNNNLELNDAHTMSSNRKTVSVIKTCPIKPGTTRPKLQYSTRSRIWIRGLPKVPSQ
jgi:hypothetical protein